MFNESNILVKRIPVYVRRLSSVFNQLFVFSRLAFLSEFAFEWTNGTATPRNGTKRTFNGVTNVWSFVTNLSTELIYAFLFRWEKRWECLFISRWMISENPNEVLFTDDVRVKGTLNRSWLKLRKKCNSGEFSFCCVKWRWKDSHIKPFVWKLIEERTHQGCT